MSIHQVLLILWARKLVILSAFLSALIVSLVVVSALPKQYTSTSTIILDVAEPDPVRGQMLPVALVRFHIRTQIRLITSDRVAGGAVDRLNLTQAQSFVSAYMDKTGGEVDIRHWIGRRLLENLHVRSVTGSNIIAISYTSLSPQLAASVTNAFADSYITEDLELRVAPSRRNAQWFAGQLNKLRQTLGDAQARLTAYQQDTGIVSLNEALDAENAKLADLTKRVTEARAQASDARSIVGQLQTFDRLQGSTTNLPNFMTSSEIKQRSDELIRIDARLAALSGSIGKNHPEFKALLAGRQVIEEQLEREIGNLRRAILAREEIAEAKVTSLEKEHLIQKEMLLKMRGDRDQLDALFREVEIRKSEYDNAFRRAGTLRLEGEVSQTAVAVMEQATVPLTHSFPQKTLTVSLASAFGFILGVALAFLFEMFDRRIRTSRDLEQASGGPVLAHIANAKGGSRTKKLYGNAQPSEEKDSVVKQNVAAAE